MTVVKYDEQVARALSEPRTWLSICFNTTNAGLASLHEIEKHPTLHEEFKQFHVEGDLPHGRIIGIGSDAKLSVKLCSNCGAHARCTACAGCKTVLYCSRACQKADWPSHRDLCTAAQTTPPQRVPPYNPLPRPLYLYLSHALRPTRPRLCKLALQTLIDALPEHRGDTVFFSLLLMYLWTYTGAGIPAYLRPRLVSTLEREMMAPAEPRVGGHMRGSTRHHTVASMLRLLARDPAFDADGSRPAALVLAEAAISDGPTALECDLLAAHRMLARLSVHIAVDQRSVRGGRVARLPQLLMNYFQAHDAISHELMKRPHLCCVLLLRGLGLVAGPLRAVARAEADALVRLWGSDAPPAEKGVMCEFSGYAVSGGGVRLVATATRDGDIVLPAGFLPELPMSLMMLVGPELTDHVLRLGQWQHERLELQARAGHRRAPDFMDDLIERSAEEVDRVVHGADVQYGGLPLAGWAMWPDLMLPNELGL